MKIDRHVIRTVGALAVGIALTLAACGDGDGDDEATSSTAAAVTTTAPVADTEVADTSADTEPVADTGSPARSDSDEGIVITDFSFTGVTEVQVGDTIVVTNADAARHTWTAVDGTFDSGPLSTDDTFEFTFEEPGEFDYFCNFHPSMTGTIVVTG